ncbi:MAG: hypothetical protein Q9182_001706 [Xanthomendoza sp. 2 TL-2023]
MDGVSVAASIVGISAAGCQIAIKLYTLATQISTASERISSISNDVSLTSGVLQQLGELMTQKATGDSTTIFSQGGLETTKKSAAMCERIFREIEQAARDASQQIRGRVGFVGGKIKLSKIEKLKWPFLQPSIDTLKHDLREAKGTLMLMLHVTSLAFSKKIHQTTWANIVEQREIINAILATQKQLQGNENPKSNHLSVSSTGNNTPTAATERAISERSLCPDEVSTLAQSHALNSLPIRPTVLMAIPSLVMPATQLPAMNLARSDERKSVPRDCDTGRRQPNGDIGSKSISSQSMRGGGILTPTHSTLCDETKRSKTLAFSLMKPIIKDLIDVIQLSWKIQIVQMQQTEIQKQMIKNKSDGLPAVHEVYQNLYTHEHYALEDEISKAGSDVNLLSLKRIYVDLTYREILFKGIPGLQIILERYVDTPVAIQSAALPGPQNFGTETDARVVPKDILNDNGNIFQDLRTFT